MSLRRLILSLLLGGFITCAIAIILFLWTFSGMGTIVDGRKLPGGAVAIKDGYVSAYLIEIDEGHVALVDTGSDPEGKAILAELSRRKLGPEAVSTILLTHGHSDHTAACALFPNAAVYADGDELPLLTGRVGSRGPLTRWFGASASTCTDIHPVKDGDEVPLGNRTARVFAVPGHTSGSTVWLFEGVLYMGDAADAAKNGTVLGSKWMFTDDPAQARRSLVNLLEQVEPLEIRMLAFAHSGTIMGLHGLSEYADHNRR